MKSALTPKPSEELYNLLKSTADIFNSRPDLQDVMKGSQGWINATVGFKTSDNKMGSAVVIKNGHITVKNHIPEDVDACLIFRTEKDFTDFHKADKDDASLMILKGRMWIEGTIALYNYCDYLVNLLYLDESRAATRDKEADEEKKNTLQAMLISMDAVSIYTKNLAEQVKKEAESASDPLRKVELEEIRRNLLRVPDKPAETLHEAIQALWIIQVALGLESTDDGPHLGRLDQLLQPYFDSDIRKLKTEKERKTYIAHALELIGCLYMRLSSHYIITMEIVSWMNSGGAPSTGIVVGGVTRDGKDAINDMTYIILKVTAMLALNDPNMHARVMVGINSETYLKRVCEVNYITGAIPCIYNDSAMIESLRKVNPDWALEDIRDWTANGCVEPCIPGLHFPTTGSVEFNLMAPLEMALNNGTHPLLE